MPVNPFALTTDSVVTVPLEEGDTAVTKSEPFHTTSALLLVGILIPVVDAPLRTTAASDWLTTKYPLLLAGAIILRDTPGVPVAIRIAQRAWLGAPEPSSFSVQFPRVTLAVAVPATASSINWVILLFTIGPHVPVSSPGTGRAKPKSVV